MPTNALDHIALLTAALRRIANGRDCDYIDFPKDRPAPCTCPKCTATAVLEQAAAWRRRGAHHQRVTNGFNPRETAIVEAWSKAVDDRRLAQILDPGAPDDKQRVFITHETLQPPTARDWFVATSVVQWLVTNVGQEVLRNAGWGYTRYDEDRKALDARRRTEEPLFAPGAHAEPGSILSFNKATWHGVIALHGEGAGEIAFHGMAVEGGCGVLLEDAEVVGRPVFVTRNADGGLVRVSVPPRPAAPSPLVVEAYDEASAVARTTDGRTWTMQKGCEAGRWSYTVNDETSTRMRLRRGGWSLHDGGVNAHDYWCIVETIPSPLRCLAPAGTHAREECNNPQPCSMHPVYR